MIVLDTHIFIWLLNGDEKILKADFLSYINEAIQKNSVFIPAICLWEISMLAAKNRIVIAGNALDWIKNAVSAPGINIYPLTPEIAYESAILPDEFHGDPADRIIIATTRILDATLLTFDKKIIKYSEKGYLKLIKPKNEKIF